MSLLGSISTGCLSADGSTNAGREHHLIRFNHKNDDSSRSILKKFFLPYPVRDDIDAQPIWKGICIEGAIDGKHKSYLCPSRVSLKDGTPTTEVVLQMCVTDCTKATSPEKWYKIPKVVNPLKSFSKKHARKCATNNKIVKGHREIVKHLLFKY